MGKFDSALTEYLWSITLDGFHDAECGDVDSGGWYALITFTDESRPLTVPPAIVGAIVYVDSQGFVYSETYTNPTFLTQKWEAIEDECAEFSDDEEE